VLRMLDQVPAAGDGRGVNSVLPLELHATQTLWTVASRCISRLFSGCPKDILDAVGQPAIGYFASTL
jgi:hypothetical protein